jgi:hypothetical protein
MAASLPDEFTLPTLKRPSPARWGTSGARPPRTLLFCTNSGGYVPASGQSIGRGTITVLRNTWTSLGNDMPKQQNARYLIAKPRRGYLISVIDAIVRSLWKSPTAIEWPAKTYDELCHDASEITGRELSSALIRCTIYGHMDLLERCSNKEGPLKWKLSKSARRLGGE